MTSQKFTFSLRRRKTLNNWAITNTIFTEIPLRITNKWLIETAHLYFHNKNTFYEHVQELKEEKAKDDKASKRRTKYQEKRLVFHDLILPL